MFSVCERYVRKMYTKIKLSVLLTFLIRSSFTNNIMYTHSLVLPGLVTVRCIKLGTRDRVFIKSALVSPRRLHTLSDGFTQDLSEYVAYVKIITRTSEKAVAVRVAHDYKGKTESARTPIFGYEASYTDSKTEG